MGGVVAHAAHVHDLGQHERGRAKARARVSTIGPRPRIWCSAGTGLRSHGEAAPVPPSSTSTSRWPSPSSNGSVSRPSTSTISRARAAGASQAIPPVAQACFARDAQAGARDRVGAAPLGRGRKIEEGEIGAGIGFAVGVEQVIGADVVLVDGLLDQPHAEQAGVKGQIVRAASPRSRSDDEFRLAALRYPRAHIRRENRPGQLGPLPDHVGCGRMIGQRHASPPRLRGQVHDRAPHCVRRRRDARDHAAAAREEERDHARTCIAP